MLIDDLKRIGNRIYNLRNKKLMTRAEVAEKSNLSDRAYADIERGNVNMKLETLLNICNALHVTPNDILVEEETFELSETHFIEIINRCSNIEKETALKLLNVYVNSL